MSLADRLNQIIEKQKITKKEFAERIGVSENYIYKLTGNSRSKKERSISNALAKLIAFEFSCDVNWLMNGDEDK